MVDLMFRDESNHVIKRATISRSRNQKVNKQADPKPAANLSIVAVATAPQPLEPLRPPPGAPLHDDDGRHGFKRPKAKTCSKRQNPAGVLSRDSPLLSALLIPDRRAADYDDVYGDAWPSSGSSDDNDKECGLPFRGHDVCAVDETLVFLPYGPSISLQERGTAFFFSRYVATDHGCYQNYDFIYDVWKPPTSGLRFAQMRPADACITTSITAVGLAGLSKVTACRETMMRAQHIYGVALQLANAALRDPVEAVKNSTMLGVLILGTYEFISGNTPQTLRAWQEHVNGAAALASMRGKAQFRTQAGIRMFLMLSNSVLISCIQSGLPMPHAIVNLRNELGQLIDNRRPSWRVIDPLYKALQIRHDIKTRRIVGIDEIVGSLAEVEANFDSLIEGLPASWRFSEVKLARANPAVMGRTCHVYPGLTQATAWNGIRTMRILVQETILEQLCSSVDDPTTLPEHHQLNIVKAMRLLRMLGEAVVGTVPQHFGIVSSRDVSRVWARGNFITAENQSSRILSTPLLPPTPPVAPPGDAQHQHQHQHQQAPARSPGTVPARPTLLDPTQSEAGSGGRDCDAERFMTLATASNTIIWPLYTLGLSSSCSAETRAYIVDRLMAIHRETGLDQARTVAGMMQDRAESLAWTDIPTARLPSLPDDALPLIV
ncbi:hypothetical protein ESCO_001092 [Escovopsis weberi]|uniref:Uncharacterized protein n=1 Tax=Escovopsis weberi TaxID=150374 RepID=A0A0M9VT93_ESCWE|nr:hypothetical protein ESCO_001092 [Escovopsis weberi]